MPLFDREKSTELFADHQASLAGAADGAVAGRGSTPRADVVAGASSRLQCREPKHDAAIGIVAPARA